MKISFELLENEWQIFTNFLMIFLTMYYIYKLYNLEWFHIQISEMYQKKIYISNKMLKNNISFMYVNWIVQYNFTKNYISICEIFSLIKIQT